MKIGSSKSLTKIGASVIKKRKNCKSRRIKRESPPVIPLVMGDAGGLIIISSNTVC
jgi:hypothetical protein